METVYVYVIFFVICNDFTFSSFCCLILRGSKPFFLIFFCIMQRENIILSMITDEDKAVLMAGYDKVIAARIEGLPFIRQFNLPEIDFQCDSYRTMICWSSFILTESPCTQFIPQEDILHLKHSDEIIKIPGDCRELTCLQLKYMIA